jgi:hypothetical protein
MEELGRRDPDETVLLQHAHKIALSFAASNTVVFAGEGYK